MENKRHLKSFSHSNNKKSNSSRFTHKITELRCSIRTISTHKEKKPDLIEYFVNESENAYLDYSQTCTERFKKSRLRSIIRVPNGYYSGMPLRENTSKTMKKNIENKNAKNSNQININSAKIDGIHRFLKAERRIKMFSSFTMNRKKGANLKLPPNLAPINQDFNDFYFKKPKLDLPSNRKPALLKPNSRDSLKLDAIDIEDDPLEATLIKQETLNQHKPKSEAVTNQQILPSAYLLKGKKPNRAKARRFGPSVNKKRTEITEDAEEAMKSVNSEYLNTPNSSNKNNVSTRITLVEEDSSKV